MPTDPRLLLTGLAGPSFEERQQARAQTRAIQQKSALERREAEELAVTRQIIGANLKEDGTINKQGVLAVAQPLGLGLRAIDAVRQFEAAEQANQKLFIDNKDKKNKIVYDALSALGGAALAITSSGKTPEEQEEMFKRAKTNTLNLGILSSDDLDDLDLGTASNLAIDPKTRFAATAELDKINRQTDAARQAQDRKFQIDKDMAAINAAIEKEKQKGISASQEKLARLNSSLRMQEERLETQNRLILSDRNAANQIAISAAKQGSEKKVAEKQDTLAAGQALGGARDSISSMLGTNKIEGAIKTPEDILRALRSGSAIPPTGVPGFIFGKLPPGLTNASRFRALGENLKAQVLPQILASAKDLKPISNTDLRVLQDSISSLNFDLPEEDVAKQLFRILEGIRHFERKLELVPEELSQQTTADPNTFTFGDTTVRVRPRPN
jgi:hypothetical protein